LTFLPGLQCPSFRNKADVPLALPDHWPGWFGNGLFQFPEAGLEGKIVRAVLGQPYPGEAAVTFIWTAIPYRMEWRYGLASHKVIALDVGHVCQNLYLACEAIDAGICAIAAYDQEAVDRMLRIDGEEEFTIYLAPVGKR